MSELSYEELCFQCDHYTQLVIEDANESIHSILETNSIPMERRVDIIEAMIEMLTKTLLKRALDKS